MSASVSESAVALPRRTAHLERAGCGLVLLLLGLAYRPAIMSLVEAWSTIETYSYGFMVPAVSAGLVWVRRDQLRQIPVTRSLGWGSLVMIAGLLMLFAGRVATLSVVQEFALIVTICGLTLLLLGRPMFQALAFPIGYLLAMVPFWDVLTAGVHPYFQDYSARVGVATLRGLGIPVIRDGFFLHLPNITLEVAQECSGVNNLIAVLCVGVAMTHLFIRRWWKRGLILAAAALIALLTNGARVGMVSVFAYYGIRGADGDIHGPYSLLRALLVAAVGFLALFWLVARFRDDQPTAHTPVAAPPSAANGQRIGFRVTLIPLALAILLLSAANVLIAWHQTSKVPLRAGLATLPQRLGFWQMTNHSSLNELSALNFDEQLSRVYTAPDGTELTVFIGYYQNQEPGRELADYRMRTILLGPDAKPWRTAVGEARVKDFLTGQRTQAYHVTYWYALGGSIVSEDYEAKLHTAWNSVAHGTSDGAVIVVRANATVGEPIEAARARVRNFLEMLIPAVTLQLPISAS